MRLGWPLVECFSHGEREIPQYYLGRRGNGERRRYGVGVDVHGAGHAYDARDSPFFMAGW